MKNLKPKLQKALNRIINILFYCCLAVIVFLLLQVFCFSSFKIPSDSMEPALQTGDNILVSKLSKGARLFNLRAAFAKEDFAIKRMPGFGSIHRNDVLVFNFPYPVTWDSISFDIMKYYVKRCVALPGDTLEIRNGYFRINGKEMMLGNTTAQEFISTLNDSLPGPVMMDTYPWDPQMKWTVKNFGPLPVPAKGQEVVMDNTSYTLYRRLISWEQGKPLKRQANDIFLGDSLIHIYRFTGNYYFMAGDKLENSQDSRYWGVLPEDYIVGKAVLIWSSKDPYSGKLRWDRIGKRIR